ncbi:MAG: hypothetical protein D6798_09090 [Deltaproteobacteria bacterium]|nr:MAG: hypothetical protein D6798_09090 [Deltaproteobacteria bacterium]
MDQKEGGEPFEGVAKETDGRRGGATSSHPRSSPMFRRHNSRNFGRSPDRGDPDRFWWCPVPSWNAHGLDRKEAS